MPQRGFIAFGGGPLEKVTIVLDLVIRFRDQRSKDTSKSNRDSTIDKVELSDCDLDQSLSRNWDFKPLAINQQSDAEISVSEDTSKSNRDSTIDKVELSDCETRSILILDPEDINAAESRQLHHTAYGSEQRTL